MPQKNQAFGARKENCKKQWKEAIILRILVDADGCPSREVIENIVKEYGCECIMFHDYSHEIESPCCECRCVESGRDSVDFAIVKECRSEDIVVTQDVGLAAMVLPKVKAVLNTYGWFYMNRNIDKLLNRRYLSSVQRQRRNFHRRSKKQGANDAQNLGRQLTKAVSA